MKFDERKKESESPNARVCVWVGGNERIKPTQIEKKNVRIFAPGFDYFFIFFLFTSIFKRRNQC